MAINKCKCHIIIDKLGLSRGVVAYAADLIDEQITDKVVKPLVGYLHRVTKTLADTVYKKGFRD